MASATAMNAWMEELCLSFLPRTTPAPDAHKHKETFIRQARAQSYGRTNQFDVIERLSGLEEKLQVLNLDDVAQELFARRMELNTSEDRWVPDVLDLLLHLSVKPTTSSRVNNLDLIKPVPQSPSPLKWKDIEIDDPIDHNDQLWRVPEYSDLSSDEDEIISSPAVTSPESAKQDKWRENEISRTFEYSGADPELSLSSSLKFDQIWRRSGYSIAVTERRSIREVLMMLGGFPTSMFKFSGNEIRSDPRYRLQNLDVETSSRLLSQAAELGSESHAVRKWLESPQSQVVMQIIESNIRDLLLKFQQTLTGLESDVSNETCSTGVITLLQLLHHLRLENSSLKIIGNLLPRLPSGDPIVSLNALYSDLDMAYVCADQTALDTILPIFTSAFSAYAEPLNTWILSGVRAKGAQCFFVTENNDSRTPTTLWHDWFLLDAKDGVGMPRFLEKYKQKIFTTGKTAAFIHHLGADTDDISNLSPAFPEIAKQVQIGQSLAIPFTATFETAIENHLSAILCLHTTLLKSVLENHCGLTRVLDAFEYIYFGRDVFIQNYIESKMFDQIDRCVEVWNDRFLLADALADGFIDIECVDPEFLNVQSTYTSSRTMESRRRSVKILTALRVSYEFPWPIANIILPASVIRYQRIALTLGMIRRAKFVLEKRAYFCVQNVPLTGDAIVQNIARTLCFTLCLFVNVVYSHFTSCTIPPMTATMRENFTGTVDEMISAHSQYTNSLEHACLSSKRSKPLHDSLVMILDLCIRFTDIVTSPLSATKQASQDFEANSFTSAQTHRRRGQLNGAEEDDSSDEEDEAGIGEGFSTFILDEDTSILEEIMRVREGFTTQVVFLMSGLRGIAMASGDTGDLLELLADSLECVFPQKVVRVY